MKFIKFFSLCSAAMLCAALTPAAAADWQAGAPAQWHATLEAAKKESAVVVAASPEFGKPLADAYARDTGLKLNFLGGGYSELETRFLREARTRNPTIDIFMGGNNATLYLSEGVLQPVGPMLILPGVTDGKNWRQGKLKFADAAQTLLVASEYLFGWPIVDANVVKPGMIESWDDLLKPIWKGKIASLDPTVPGPGQGVATWLAAERGIDFAIKLYQAQDARFVRNPRQLVEWVARGTQPIALAAVPSFVETFRKEGAGNVAVAHFARAGAHLTAGQSILVTPKGTPNPNATKVFVNWFASQPGQQVYVETWKVPSRRLDVANTDVPQYVIPADNAAYFEAYSEEFLLRQRPKLNEELVQRLGR